MTNSSQGFNDDAAGTETSDTSDDYDLDGNMTKDENKDITLIKYNHLNLPTEIQFTNNRTINYMYDATGAKLKKEVNDGTYTTITDYIDGYQYENKHINIGGRGYTHLLFFPHAEGYVKPVYSENKTLTTRLFSYVYNHTDHLGNIRMSYAKVDGVTKVLEENNYYPFGLKHQNYNATKSKLSLKASNNQKQVTTTVENPFKYKYNGKELQEEFDLNLYDYGARNYDPAIGRWFNTDPLAEETESLTPYHYVSNNPMFYTDPTGMSQESINSLFVNKSGRVVEQRNDGDDTVYQVGDDWQAGDSKSGTTAIGHYNYSEWFSKGEQVDQTRFSDANGSHLYSRRLQTGAIDFDYTIEGFVMPVFGFLKYIKIGGKYVLAVITKSGSKIIVKILGKGKVGKFVFKITAQEGDLIFMSTKIGDDVIEFGGNFAKTKNVLTIKNFSIDGNLTNKLGIKKLKEIMTTLGKQNGVKKVVIKGTPRTTGANPGKITNLEFLIK